MEVSEELVELIRQLAPGFVAAWIFYGLTPHPKSTPFERVIQALVFTVIIQAVVAVGRYSAISAGRLGTVGRWTEDSALLWSLGLAVITGLLFARWANNNCWHAWLSEWKWYDRQRKRRCWGWLPAWDWTSRTSHASQWFGALHRDGKFVVLHFKGNSRRLYGYPLEWPDHPDQGHFVLCQVAWFGEDGELIPQLTVDKLLIAVQDVEMVEIIKSEQDRAAIDQVVLDNHQRMMNLQQPKENPREPIPQSEAVPEQGGAGGQPSPGTGQRATAEGAARVPATTQEVALKPSPSVTEIHYG